MCHDAGIAVTLPKPQTSGAKSDGRFGKQDFVCLPEEDVYRRKTASGYGATGPQPVKIVHLNRSARQGQGGGFHDGSILEAVQQRLDANPQAMRQRRETVEHPFGTLKARMGATRFLTKTIPKVAAEMALSVLAYNLTRVMNIVGIKPLIAAIAA